MPPELTTRAEPSAIACRLIRALRERVVGDVAVVSSTGERRAADAVADGAEAVARGLVARGLRPGQPVVLWMSREADIVSAVLGVLRAGGAWLAVDPAQAARARRQLTDAPGALLVHGQHAPPPGYSGPAHPLPTLLQTPAGPLPAEPTGDLPAYVVFTSGSTGRPKGAVNTRAGLAWLLDSWRDAGILSARRIMLAQSSLAFDMSVLQLLLPVLVGGQVALVAPGAERDARALASACDGLGATDLLCPPTSWRLLRAAGWQPPAGLRVLFGAERVSTDVLDDALRCGVEVWTGWGVSEASACVTLGHLTDSADISLGMPVAGARVRIVNERGRDCGPEESGELWIGGPPVGLGYLGEGEEAGAERFWSDDSGCRWYRTGDEGRWRSDGAITFLGRADDQVKVRGYRIEPAEVEMALRRLDGVEDAAVYARPGPAGHDVLVAWLVMSGERILRPAEQRDALADRLPAWLVPSLWHQVVTLPTTVSGKTDRRRLLHPPDGDNEVQPLAAVEDAPAAGPAAELFAAAVGQDRVTNTSDFFLLGGDSLGAARLLQSLRETLGLSLSLADFWHEPTPAGLRRHLANRDAPGRRREDLATVPGTAPAVGPTGPGPAEAPLTAGQRQMLLVQALDPKDSTWHVGVRLRLAGPIRPRLLSDALARVQATHAGLRTTLHIDTCTQRRHETLPIAWRRVDLSGARDVDAKLRHLQERTLAAPFDLSRQAPIRATLARCAPTQHVLILAAHHAALDGASVAILLDDLALALAGRRLESAQTDVQALGVWQQAQPNDTAWWREALHGFAAPGPLPARPPDDPTDDPTDGDPSVSQANGAATGHHVSAVSAATWRALITRARELRATAHMALMAVWGAWLARALDQPRVVVATVAEGRRTRMERQLIGHLANIVLVPLHFDLGASDPSTTRETPQTRALREIDDALRTTRDAMVQAASHAEVPFDDVVRAAGLAGRTLARTGVLLQPAAPEPRVVGAVTIDPTLLPARGAVFDLGIEAREGVDGGLSLSWTWRRAHARDDDVIAAVGAFHRWLDAHVWPDQGDSASTHGDAGRLAARLPWDGALEAQLLESESVVDARVQSRVTSAGRLQPVAYVLPSAPDALRLPRDAQLAGVWTAPVARLPAVDTHLLRRVPIVASPSDRDALALPARYDSRPTLVTPPPVETRAGRVAELVGPRLTPPGDGVKTLKALLDRAAGEGGAPPRDANMASPSSVAICQHDAAWLRREALHLAESLNASAEIVAIQAPTPIKLLTGIWAAWLSGRVAAPLAADLRDDKLRTALLATGADVLLQEQPDRAALQHIAAPTSPAPRAHADEQLDGRGADEPATALILLTSGSTSGPKAVRHSDATLLAQAAAWRQHQGWRPTDVFLNWLPLDHVAALLMFHLQPLYARADQHHLQPSDVLAEPTRWLDAVEALRASVTWAPNFAVALLVEALHGAEAAERRWDLSCLRAVLNGGEAIVPATAARFVGLLSEHGMAPDALCPGWGMSETASVCVVRQGCASDAIPAVGLMPLGRPTPGHALRICALGGGDSGRVLAEGETGLLEVRGPGLMLGYAGRAPRRPGSWLATGDLARVVDGELQVVGRADDTLVLLGVNHAPVEIESIALADPEVRSPHVAAFSARRAGESTAGLIVAVALSSDADRQLVAARLRAAIASSTGLETRQIVALAATQLPRTALGKVQRRTLQRQYEQGELDALLCLPQDGVWGVWRQVWSPWRSMSSAPGERAGVTWVLNAPELAEALRRRGQDAHAGGDWAAIAPCPSTIVWASAGQPAREVDARRWRSVDDAVRAAASIARRVARRWPDARPRWLVYPRDPSEVAAPAVHGLWRSLDRERPGSAVLCVHACDTTAMTPSAWAADVDALLRRPWRGTQDLRRSGAGWSAWRLRPAPAALPPTPATSAMRVVLLGGRGGVGAVLSARLRSRGARHLVLSRSAPDQGALKRVRDDALRTDALADVTVDGAVEAEIAAWERRHGPMTHLVNLVATAAQATLDAEQPPPTSGTPSAWAARLAANVVAQDAVARRPGARLVDVNSVNAWLPAPGLGAYGAGALAGVVSAAGLGERATCLLMTGWSGVGLSAGRYGDDIARRHGLVPLAAETAVSLVEAALSAPGGSIWTGVNGGAAGMARHCEVGPLIRVGSSNPAHEVDRFGTQIRTTRRSTARRQRVAPADGHERTVAEIWRRLLEQDDVDVTRNFFDLGGHSLLVARLRMALQRAFQVEIAMVDLFARPTVRAQAAWLMDHPARGQDQGGATAPSTASGGRDDTAGGAPERLDVLGRTT